ncbi:TIGR00645 family protein [uncultured Rhodoblastus sp.]|uniref:TIGR00645 family protein n=1 Tax=uncultured Rhodoblastus sp. TaxID=543037 RepID=UPI0025DC9D02|nr:TIGR00645 family protein [uncultured Rhodoblastus sp.]
MESENKLVSGLENLLFSSRWLLAPFFAALALSLFILLLKTGQHMVHLAETAFGLTESEVVLEVLGLIDLSLTGSLVVLVIFSGYENFVSRTEPGRNTSWPKWLATIDFGGLKLKLISSIVAISGIQTLRAFMNVQNESDRSLSWSVGIHLTFVVSAVLLALSERISHGGSKADDGGH